MPKPSAGPTEQRPSSKRLAIYVVLVLMSMVLSFIEVSFFSEAAWLKYDASGAVVALAALMYGPWMGIAIAALSWIPHAAMSPLGALMNIAASASMALVLGMAHRARPNRGGAVLAALGAVTCATAVSICLNFVVTPLYLGATYEEVAGLVVPYLLPFNVIKAVVNILAGLLANRQVKRLLIEEDEQAPEGPASAH